MSTHQQLLYHIVFSTKNRRPYLQNDEFRHDVFSYLAGICNNIGGRSLLVNGFHEHVHLLVRIPAKLAVARFVGDIKANTSRHINESIGRIAKFGWQDGYGAFTVSPSQKDKAYRYIANQVEHHSREKFEDEYIRLLKRHEIEFDRAFVFD